MCKRKENKQNRTVEQIAENWKEGRLQFYIDMLMCLYMLRLKSLGSCIFVGILPSTSDF